MSNYPRGVTGRELEIAGPDWEGETERSCTQKDVTLFVMTGDAAGSIVLWHKVHPDQPMTAEQLLSNCVEVEVEECPAIDMEVDAWAYGGILHWTCPVCGHEYEEDRRDAE